MLRPFRFLTAFLVCCLSVASLATAGGGDADAAETALAPCSGVVGVQCQHTHCHPWGCNTFTCLQYVGLGTNHPGLGSCTHVG